MMATRIATTVPHEPRRAIPAVGRQTSDLSAPSLSDPEHLTRRIRERLPSLSRQLKAIGQYVLQHADHMAGQRIQDVAQRCGVKPSAVTRFAKHFGLAGSRVNRTNCGRTSRGTG